MSQGTYIRGSLYPRALYRRELISKGAFLTEIKKKCTSKQAIIVLIKIRLAFTGFQASRCNIFLEEAGEGL